MRPLAMGSAAVVGAGLIAATPVTPPLDERAMAQINDVAVQLTANSIANIPVNLFRIMMDWEKNSLDGLNAAAESLEGSGNWWLYGPTNALGWDHMDWAKAVGFTKMFTPIPEVAAAQAAQLNAIMARNFPMTPECTGAPAPCADPFYFTQYFTTPPWEALFGYSYQFGPVFNTIDPSIEMPWSNQTLTYDPWGPGKALWNALTKDPEEGWTPERTYLLDRMEASERFWKSVFNSFNPFVEGTYCLPCQLLGFKGPKSSLPLVSIFGNFYTYLDFGQEFSEDWVAPHPAVPKPPTVKALSLYTPEAWERIGRDIQTYYNWIFKGGPMPQIELEEPSMYPEVPEPAPLPTGLEGEGPARVLTVKGTEIYDIDGILNGSVCDGSLGDCENVEYIRWLQEASIRDGLKNLTALLADPDGDPATVLGYSEGSVIASRWLSNYQKAYAKAQAEGKLDVEGAPDAEDLHFILTANPNRKYGGVRPAWYIERATPTDTKYTVLDVAREYDGAADWPDDPFNLLAVANAMAGYFVIHPYYNDVDLQNDPKLVFQEGNTTYVLMRTQDLPMLYGLRQMGLNRLADQLQAQWKPIIDSAYKRDYPNVIEDEAAAQEAVDRAKAGLPPLTSGEEGDEGAEDAGDNDGDNSLTPAVQRVASVFDSAPRAESRATARTQSPAVEDKDKKVEQPADTQPVTPPAAEETPQEAAPAPAPEAPAEEKADEKADDAKAADQKSEQKRVNPFKPWGSSKQRGEAADKPAQETGKRSAESRAKKSGSESSKKDRGSSSKRDAA
ncbi:PE-PPE domain-containing protein [Mycolicibacterium vaccae]|uniref:PE-PPE domain-containing protein n=1 Tax=Mycolicibacterium vaccae TaxID=1810 RepID=UPI003CECF937